MDALVGHRTRVSLTLRTRPVIAALFNSDDVGAFLDTDAPIGILANFDLLTLEPTMVQLQREKRFVFVNADSVAGLSVDAGGIEYLAKIGATGVLSTRSGAIGKIESVGMLSMQKLFVTDRLNLPRSTHGLEGSHPSFVQIMPAPVLPFVMDEPIMKISPVIAGGFVASERFLLDVLACGAAGVSTSQRSLWSYRREEH